MASIDESSRQLWTDYIDLLLVHWPRVSAPLEAQIAGLNPAEQAGKARHIGVSNHNAAMFSAAVALSDHPLVTNQVEYHPHLNQSTLLAEIRSRASNFMAYCPMTVGRVFEDLLLSRIAVVCVE